jgi:hypothetical protein
MRVSATPDSHHTLQKPHPANRRERPTVACDTQPAHNPLRPQTTRTTCKENDPAMRPKKIILCVDDNEQTLSIRTFLL